MPCSIEERVGREAEDWAFAHLGDELVTAGRQLTRQLAGSSQATWITEHWVMLDYELRDGGTAASRYAALPYLGRADRNIAARIARSRIGVHRVLASRPGDGMDLVDLLRGGHMTVACDVLPDALEYDRFEDGADVFVWRIGPDPTDYGGFFELLAPDWFDGVSTAIDHLEQVIQNAPLAALLLAEHAIERLEGSGIDDSDGWLNQAILRLEQLHAAACQAAAIPSLELATRLRALAANSDFESFWNAPETHRDALGPVGLRALSDPSAGA